ncbi:hypothetical protein BDV06DRAFT_229556 [Aspergillus oleicola]
MAVSSTPKGGIAFPFAHLDDARVSLAAIDYIISLMAFEPDDRITTGAALEHGWIQQNVIAPV